MAGYGVDRIADFHIKVDGIRIPAFTKPFDTLLLCHGEKHFRRFVNRFVNISVIVAGGALLVKIKNIVCHRDYFVILTAEHSTIGKYMLNFSKTHCNYSDNVIC